MEALVVIDSILKTVEGCLHTIVHNHFGHGAPIICIRVLNYEYSLSSIKVEHMIHYNFYIIRLYIQNTNIHQKYLKFNFHMYANMKF